MILDLQRKFAQNLLIQNMLQQDGNNCLLALIKNKFRYRAPELILSATNYNSPVDIFALGCIMAELYNLQPLFCGTTSLD